VCYNVLTKCVRINELSTGYPQLAKEAFAASNFTGGEFQVNIFGMDATSTATIVTNTTYTVDLLIGIAGLLLFDLLRRLIIAPHL